MRRLKSVLSGKSNAEVEYHKYIVYHCLLLIKISDICKLIFCFTRRHNRPHELACDYAGYETGTNYIPMEKMLYNEQNELADKIYDKPVLCGMYHRSSFCEPRCFHRR